MTKLTSHGAMLPDIDAHRANQPWQRRDVFWWECSALPSFARSYSDRLRW